MYRIDRRLQLLANPTFRWYIISCLLATFGSGLSYVSMNWLILKADNSLSSTAFLMFSFWVPMVLLGPFLGVVADHYSRKWLMVLSNGIRAVLLIAFGWYLHSHLSLGIIYSLMALLGVCFSIYLPAAIALVREIVPPDDLLYANSAVDIAYEVGNVLGMGSAGFFIAIFSLPVAILANGIIFIVCTLAMMKVRIYKKIETTQPSSFNVLKEFKWGLNYLSKKPTLIIIYSVQLLLLVGFMTTPGLLAPFAKNVLHATVKQFGQINAALSVGVVLGGVFVPSVVKRFGLIKSLMIMCVGLAVCFGIFGMNRVIIRAEVLYFIIGFGLSVWPMIVTKAQSLTDLTFQARTQSIFNSLSGIIILCVYLSVALGSHYVSVTVLYSFEVMLMLLAGFLLWANRKRLLIEEVRQVTDPGV